MFCINCGNSVPDDSTFCTSCGTAVDNANGVSAQITSWPEDESKNSMPDVISAYAQADQGSDYSQYQNYYSPPEQNFGPTYQPPKRKKTGAFIVILIVVVLIVGISGVVIYTASSGIFSDVISGSSETSSFLPSGDGVVVSPAEGSFYLLAPDGWYIYDSGDTTISYSTNDSAYIDMYYYSDEEYYNNLSEDIKSLYDVYPDAFGDIVYLSIGGYEAAYFSYFFTDEEYGDFYGYELIAIDSQDNLIELDGYYITSGMPSDQEWEYLLETMMTLK